MVDKYILFNLDDDAAKTLGDAISNPTSKKIMSYLSEHADEKKGASESDLVKALDLPANTVHYNVKRLVEAGLLEPATSFWSSRGKKMPHYRVSQKMIVISPKKTSQASVAQKLRGLLPAVALLALITLVIGAQFGFGDYAQAYAYGVGELSSLESSSSAVARNALDDGEQAVMAAAPAVEDALGPAKDLDESLVVPTLPEPWMWFGLGCLVTLIIVSVTRWKQL